MDFAEILPFVCGIVSFLVAGGLVVWITKQPSGTKEMIDISNAVKEGAVVVDVGISRTSAGLLGDVDPGVMEVASFVAPMPGGVGPMTRAMLLQNVVEACER